MKNIKKQAGQSMTEYLIVSIVVMVMLGVGFGKGSVITMFLSGVQTGFDRFSYFMSLP